MFIKSRIQQLRAFIQGQLNLIACDLSQTSLDNVQLKMAAAFETLTAAVNNRLDAIENDLVAAQSARVPSRNWHYVVLAGGVMFLLGFLLSAYLLMLGAVG